MAENDGPVRSGFGCHRVPSCPRSTSPGRASRPWRLVVAFVLATIWIVLLPGGAPAQETDPCPKGFHYERMSGTGCVQNRNEFPEYGHPGYTGSPVCDLGAAVTEWREVKAEVPGNPGAGAFPYLCYCDTDVDRNPGATDLKRCSNLPQLLEDSRVERGVIVPEPTIVEDTTEITTETTAEPSTSTTGSESTASPSTTTPAAAASATSGGEKGPPTGIPIGPQAALLTVVAAAGIGLQSSRSGVVGQDLAGIVATGGGPSDVLRRVLEEGKQNLHDRLMKRYQDAMRRLKKHRIIRRPGEIIERGERRFRAAQARLDRRSREIRERIQRPGRRLADRIEHSRVVRRGREIVAKARENYEIAQGVHVLATDKRARRQAVDQEVDRTVHRRLVGSGVSPLVVTAFGGEKSIGRSVKRFVHDPRRELRRVGRTLRNPRNVAHEVGRGLRRVGRAVGNSALGRVGRWFGHLFGRRRRHR